MKIRSILLSLLLILLVGVATTATTWARCPRGCGRFRPFYVSIPNNNYYSTIKGRIIAITNQQLIIETAIGFVNIAYNLFRPYPYPIIGRQVVIITEPSRLPPDKRKQIVIVGIIKNRKKYFLNRPIYCRIKHYYKYKRKNFYNRRIKNRYWLRW